MAVTLAWRKEIGLAICLGAATFAAYGLLFEGGAVPFSPHSDLIAVHLSVKQAAYAAIQAGQGLPFWRSDMLSGGLALTHPQAIYTNPLQLPFLVTDPASASGPSIWLHFFAMALSMQVLGGALGLSWLGRAFMAIAGLFSFKLIIITYAGWLPVLPGFVTAPLLMAAVIKTIERPGVSSAFGLALAGVLALQSGHLQVSYYTTVFFGIYLLVRCVAWVRQQETEHAIRVVATGAVASVCAVLASAFLLLPLFSEIDLTARAALDYDFLQSGGAYALENLATFLHPEFFGTPLDGSYAPVELWENVAYFGGVAQLLAILGFTLGRRRPYAIFFSVALLLSIFLAFDTFVLRALYDYLPGFSMFRIPSRFLFVTTLFGIALAGIGFDEVIERVRARLSPQLASRVVPAVGLLLILGSGAEGAAYSRRYITMEPTEKAVPKTQYAEFLREDSSTFRVAPLHRDTLSYGWAALMDLELVTGFEPYNYVHYQEYIGLMTSNRVIEPAPVMWIDVTRIARRDLFDTLNIKYVLTTKEMEAVPSGFVPVARFEDEPIFAFYEGLSKSPIVIYENTKAKPRAYWAADVVAVEGHEQALNVALKINANNRTVVESPPGGLRPSLLSQGDTLDVSKSHAGEVTLTANSRNGGFAVVSEVWHPGWTATLDGEHLEISRTNVALMGVQIPAGSHTVEIQFKPLRFDVAMTLTGLGALGILGLFTGFLRNVIRARGVTQASASSG